MRPKPRVQMVSEAHERSHHGHTGTTRHSPRNGFTVSFVLSPVTSLFDTVACASSRRLDASIGASEPHDFAVRVSAIRQRHHRVHRIPPHVRDDRETPLRGTGRNGGYYCFYLAVKRNFGKSEIK